MAAPAISPPVAGVVSLSAERTAQGQDVLPFAAKLIAPVLFITAKGDRYGAAEATPQLYAAATRRPRGLTRPEPPVSSVKGASPGRVGPNCEPHLTQPLRRGPGGRR